jgi:hypothetical protein
MRLTIFGFVLLVIFFSTPAFSQVKQWIDNKGTLHFEGTGPPRPRNTNLSEAEPNAARPIERNFANLRLGDDESPFTAAKKGVYIASDGYEGNFYSYSAALPEGAIRMGVLFSTGRLAVITVEYRDFGSQGWDQLVKQTTKQYGPALGDTRFMVWNDGITLLSLQHEPSGNITVTLEDFAATSRYSEQVRASLPKF